MTRANEGAERGFTNTSIYHTLVAVHVHFRNEHLTLQQNRASSQLLNCDQQQLQSPTRSMDHTTSLPFQAQAHDALRKGLSSLKEDALQKHPVQVIQETTAMPGVECANPQMLRDLYGIAFPAKVEIERQILGKFGRLPGLPSSRLGLESMTGELDQFGFESYLGLPEHSVDMPVDMHSQMEAKLGLGPATKPLARGML